MLSLSELRQKYPQYSDMSDDSFASAFYDKYYSDMDREEFNKKIGLSGPQLETNQSDMSQSLKSFFSKTPQESNVLNLMQENPAVDEAVGALLEIIAPLLIGGGVGSLGVKGVQAAGKYGSKKFYEALKGNISKEKLESNIRAAKGTETPLGEILQNPYLKKFQEDILTSLPFSGANQSYQRAGQQVTDKGIDLLRKISGGELPTSENISVSLQQAALKSVEQASKLKNKNYKEVNELADKQGLSISSNNFINEVKTILGEMGADPRLQQTLPSSIKSELQSYLGFSGQNFDLKGSNIFKGALGNKSSEYFIGGDKYLSGVYERLRSSVDKDIKDSIDMMGTQQIKDALKKADLFYKENIVPLEAKEIVNYARKGGDPETLISTFVKKGDDRSLLMKKLTDLLQKQGPQAMDDFRYATFAKSMQNGEFSPQTFKSIFEKLGPNQKKVMFEGKDALLKAMEDYSNLVGMNQKSLNIMSNQPNGQTLKQMGVLGTGVIGGSAGGPAGALFGLAAPAIVGKAASPLTRYLSSEKARNDIMKKLFEEGFKKSPKGK